MAKRRKASTKKAKSGIMVGVFAAIGTLIVFSVAKFAKAKSPQAAKILPSNI